MNLSYNISENVKSYLDKIDKLRIQILTFPISPKDELRLKWDSILERTIWSLSILDIPISKTDAITLLSKRIPIRMFPVKGTSLQAVQKDILNQRRAFTYIREDWLASKSSVTMAVVKKLYEISCKETLGPISGLTEYSEKRMGTWLTYLEKGQDHPAIQAGIAQVETINTTPFDNGNGRVGRLLSYLYLYKAGYDIRDMFILEEFYKRDIVTYKKMLDLAKIQGNLTLWLEYFTFGMGLAMEKTLDVIKNMKFAENLPASFWKLNSRQRQILESMEQPGVKITNKEVVKKFRVSQVTSSRNLVKLASLGLLLTHGKGRSVYYTRV